MNFKLQKGKAAEWKFRHNATITGASGGFGSPISGGESSGRVPPLGPLCADERRVTKGQRARCRLSLVN